MKPIAMVVLLWISFTPAVLAQDEAAAQYKSSCANCHNTNGDGQTAAGKRMTMPDLRAHAIQSLSDEQLFQTIANGAQHKQYPHTFLKKGMTEVQIRQLVQHIRTFKKN